MVQLSFFLALPLLASAFATPVKRTVAQVEADIRNISTQVTSLDSAINGFPASGLAGALGIHNAAGTLETAVNQGTTDVKATGTVSEADGQTILSSIQAFEPAILDALKAIATKKAAFDSQPITGLSALVRADLQTLSTVTNAFADALVVTAPADLKAQATTIQTTIAQAFATAIAAYS
ncbi:hydrophobic surface binding protein [Mycena vulgaris]|nr:hydrophobic surface binding protein [Mycena vulgaris]